MAGQDRRSSMEVLAELEEEYNDLKDDMEEMRRQLQSKEVALQRERRRSGRSPGRSPGPNIQDDLVLDNTIKARPTKYNGSTDWTTYQNQFEMIAGLHGWNDETKKFMLFTALEGEALATVGMYRDLSYEESTYLLTKAFGPGEEETAIAKLHARVLKKDETLDHLARDLKLLVRSAKPNDSIRSQLATAAEFFIKALPDPEVRLKLKDQRVRDIDEAVCRAEILIANRESEKRISNEVKSSDPTTEEKIKKLEDELSQLTTKSKKDEKNEHKACAGGFEERRKDEHYKDEDRKGFHQNYRGNRGRGRGHNRGYNRGRGRGYGRGSRGNFQGNYYRPRGPVTCYKCGLKGHMQMWCPMNQHQSPQMQGWTSFPNPSAPAFSPSSHSSTYDSNQSLNHLNRGGQV